MCLGEANDQDIPGQPTTWITKSTLNQYAPVTFLEEDEPEEEQDVKAIEDVSYTSIKYV